ncbi:MAG: sensor domain-containing diguanylate cyclase [Candidatus Omnitrophica bacterium]|nr:sensor domain-containing diguanylate cyclase [Candidatus Omnitrophota bacterium]
MLLLRNLIFLIVVLYTFILNLLLFLNKVFSPVFYFVSLTIIVALFIVIEVLHSLRVKEMIQSIHREKERLELNAMDMENESILLKTLTDILETFGEEIYIEEVLDKITESVKNIFKQETVALQLMGETFKKSIIGKSVEIPDEMLGGIVLKPRPILVNNTSSFPEYKNLVSQGVTSFIISAFHHKRKITGMIGVFSFENRVFTLKDLELLRMVSAPTSLLVENAELFEKTKLLAITDVLTSVYNRRHFENIFETTVNEARDKKQPLCVCMADIDYFKHYNDLNGHPAGDYALKKIAEIMKKNIKGSDIVARYGGEEFILVFPDTKKENALSLCETIRQSIKEFRFNNEEAQPNRDLTISMGIASYPEDGETGEELIKKADFALYKAKELGRNRVITA